MDDDLRELFWVTAGGRRLKIKEIGNEHLKNIQSHIKQNWEAYEIKYGEHLLKKYQMAVLQELRLRKLNHIKNNPDNKDLF